MYPPAEWLLENAAFLIHPGQGIESGALAIGGGRVLATGEEARLTVQPQTARVDLGGRFAQPGFLDAHTHLPEYGIWLSFPDLSDAGSLTEVLERTADERDRTSRGDWVMGRSWDESGWAERRMPARADLDRACPDHPAFLLRADMHMGVVNTAGLERLGLPPEDHPDGHLVEGPFFTAYESLRPGPERRRAGLRTAVAACHAEGVTAVHSTLSIGDFRLLQAAGDAGELGVGVTGYVRAQGLDALEVLGLGTGFGDEELRLGGLKLFLDGSVGARSAAFETDYADVPGQRGDLLYSREALETLLARCRDAALQPALHCIGDRAVGTALEALAGVGFPPGLRPRLEHCEFLGEGDLDRMVGQGAVASCQPNFLGQWGGPGRLYEQRLGRARSRSGNPYRRLGDAGAALAFGSDHMPFGPRYGLHWAVNAPHAAQRLEPAEALAAYTRGAAFAGFEETWRGTLEPGMRADVAVLSADPRVHPDRITELKVDLTMAGGRVMHDPAGLAGAPRVAAP